MNSNVLELFKAEEEIYNEMGTEQQSKARNMVIVWY